MIEKSAKLEQMISFDSHSSPAQFIASIIRNPFFLLLFFASYGPSINIVGQLRVTEIILLLIGAFYIRDISRSVRRNEVFFAAIFVFTAMCYVFFDLINQGITASTFKRAGSYILLGTEFLIISWLISKDRRKMFAALLGFCLSFFIVYIFGISIPNNNFHDLPWALGIGKGATIITFVTMVCFPRLRHIFVILIIALIIAHIIMGSRNLVLLTSTTLLLCIFSEIFGIKKPPQFNFRQLGLIVILSGSIAILLFGSYLALKNYKILPEEIVIKMDRQINSPYGLITSARPDVAAAIIGVTKNPFTGYGSGVVDEEIFRNFNRFYYLGDEKKVSDQMLLIDQWEASPSHSHIFGAWVDAGFLASISWIIVLIFTTKILIQSSFYQNPLTPLTLFASLTLLWDVIFSPGPNRIEVGLILTLLFMALYRMQITKT